MPCNPPPRRHSRGCTSSPHPPNPRSRAALARVQASPTSRDHPTIFKLEESPLRSRKHHDRQAVMPKDQHLHLAPQSRGEPFVIFALHRPSPLLDRLSPLLVCCNRTLRSPRYRIATLHAHPRSSRSPCPWRSCSAPRDARPDKIPRSTRYKPALQRPSLPLGDPPRRPRRLRLPAPAVPHRSRPPISPSSTCMTARTSSTAAPPISPGQTWNAHTTADRLTEAGRDRAGHPRRRRQHRPPSHGRVHPHARLQDGRRRGTKVRPPPHRRAEAAHRPHLPHPARRRRTPV